MGAKSECVVQTMITLQQESDIKGILNQMELITTNGIESETKALKSLLWPVPTWKDFDVLYKFIQQHEISPNIFSIGCGTGLLEYLLLGYLNLADAGQSDARKSSPCISYSMTGIEVDSLWWQSKYSPPLFMPVRYVNENFSSEETFGEKNNLAIFSYFNNMRIFAQYLDAFQGTYVAIIGPVQKQVRITQFCAPNPLDLHENPEELPTKEWNLLLFQRFGLAEVDYIGIYSRIAHNI